MPSTAGSIAASAASGNRATVELEPCYGTRLIGELAIVLSLFGRVEHGSEPGARLPAGCYQVVSGEGSSRRRRADTDRLGDLQPTLDVPCPLLADQRQQPFGELVGVGG